MKKLSSSELNTDTACVKLNDSDGSMISINCTAVEDEVAKSRSQRSELDWLICNGPLSYVELIRKMILVRQKGCFLIGHREPPKKICTVLCTVVEEHTVRHGATALIAGRYGCFDSLAAKAAKQNCPAINRIRIHCIPFQNGAFFEMLRNICALCCGGAGRILRFLHCGGLRKRDTMGPEI